MNVKRLVISFIALVFVIAALLIFFKNKNKNKISTSLPLSTPSIEEQIEGKFSGLVIPDDGEKIELKNISEGEGMGVATKKGLYADLPDLEKGENYQVVLGEGDKTIILGSLVKVKGGWVLEYDLSKYEGYDQIAVVKNGVRILEGTF